MNNSIIYQIKTAIVSSNKIAILFAILMCTKAAGFIPSIQDLWYYVACIIFAIFCFLKTRGLVKTLGLLISFVFFQLMVLDCPPIFNVWMRFGLFVLMLLCISPLLQSVELIYVRRQIWLVCTLFNIIIAIGSFFCYFADINFMRRGEFDGVIDVGLFGGLCVHSMMLGPIAGYATICLSAKAYRDHKLIYWLLVIMSFCSILFSASRAALVSTVAGIAMLLYSLSPSKSKYIKVIVSIIMIGAITFPLWQDATNYVMTKQSSNMDNGSAFYSRESKWINRIEEFKSSPIIGMGFDVVSTNTDDYSPYTGNIEPGSSWLATFSMLGLVGAIIIGYFFVQCVRNVRKSNDSISSLLLGLLVFFGIHMIAEGYFFSAGGYLFFMVWLVLSVSYDSKSYF